MLICIFLPYTTGILAAAWPCGIIVLISEIFRSGSISQVYGNVHQFFSDQSAVLTKLGMMVCICYITGSICDMSY